MKTRIHIHPIAFILILIATLTVGLGYGTLMGIKNFERTAINQDKAIYNPTNGNFQWK